MRRIGLQWGMLLACLAGVVGLAVGVRAGSRPSDETHWHDNIYSAHRQAISSNKPMLIVISSDWCSHCKKLWGSTLNDPQLVSQLNREFVPVHLNFDHHKQVARALDVKSIPATIVLSPRADLLGRIMGYVDAKRYGAALEKASGLGQRLETAQIAP